MNLRHIEVFHALMHSPNMTEAARRLHVSQPAVSIVLKHAEQRLGMKLFERSGGRLVPTSEAIALLPDVEDIFHRLESLGRSAEGMRDAASGVIAVAASPTLANTMLAPAIAAFTRQRPGVHVVLRALPGSEILAGVRDRTVDLGIVYEPPIPLDDELVGESVHTTHVACIMSREHPLAGRRVVRPKDLARLSVVTFGPFTPLGARIDAAFRAEGVTPNLAVESSCSLTSCFLVAAGCGVALIDSAASVDAFPRLVVRQFAPRIESRVILLHRRNRPRSRLAVAFTQQVMKSVPPKVEYAGRVGRDGEHRRAECGVDRSGRGECGKREPAGPAEAFEGNGPGAGPVARGRTGTRRHRDAAL